MACSIDLANLGLRFNPLPLTNTTSLNQRRIRPIAFPTSLDLKHPHRRISCSAVDEEQIQQTEENSFSDAENSLISSLIGIQGRGRSASPLQLKTSSSLIEGRWQLIFTTRPGTASPIQRTFVGVDLFSVFQEIYLQTNDPRVSNIVKFSDAIGELKVEAAATIKDGKRILFRFDKAAFAFKFIPFKVPYPVPFRLLGDEAKGWLDTTYLSESGNIRISRGNKGTTFVLQKRTEPRQRLLSAISSGSSVIQAIDEFVSLNQTARKGEQQLVEGEWQMIWSSQMETDSWIENAANGLMGSQIVKENGRLKFLVDILFGFKFSMNGTFEKSGTNVYDVTMDDGAIVVGPYGLPVELVTKFKLEVLYSDDKIRITRGYSNILFVHLRVDR
ncbi:Plastid lipid-associated protein/fibrillin conserved domain-containing protein [Cynara cardunculus var. scolymus]|uniref:Plastid lipid-associated protein/fibrillin conserved domain-containing protein n=1 Tax=Cynara cardunculus var. scolymus TaxID=59895 RepID=A0A118JZQ1_CYNCS|nr:Plastid lipid-associated protein/fibrillin conserved domain-containing protein [Cynara cardunculus var. scolymus]